VADDIDLHLGRRIFRRRRLLGMTQNDVAVRVGVRFQQIQKYECGASTIAAGRLWQIAQALGANVSWFYEGLPESQTPGIAKADTPDTTDLVSTFERLDATPRRKILALARSLTTGP
jgi:transcriptional regulator with XRE-family HTH domain